MTSPSISSQTADKTFGGYLLDCRRISIHCFAGLGIVTIALLASGAGASAQVSVLTQHNDNFRDGVNAGETVLTPENVNPTQFGMLFKLTVDDQVFAQPLIVARVAIAGGVHNLLYVATANNSIYAFDADSGSLYRHGRWPAKSVMSPCRASVATSIRR